MKYPDKTSISDLASLIEDFYYVETKDGEVKPFILNNKQNQLVKNIEESKSNRIMVLKGRQFGFSSLILALYLTKCLVVPNTRAVVISHTEDATKKLFRRVRFYLSKLPLPTAADKESEKELSFPKTNSYFYIGTAGAKSFGRGDNITDLHCSEVAFWENAPLIMNGLIQAVGKDGLAIIETTANGLGNYFQRLWGKSYMVPQSAWDAQFYVWTDFKEYELDVPEGFTLTDEERALQIIHPELTIAKIAWRRWKISETETDGSISPEDLFRQEYPLTPEEAFIATGRPVFNQNALMSYATQAGEYKGNLLVFDPPTNDKSYFIGCDVAEGIETGDFSVIQVLDNAMKQVAEWHGHIDPDLFASRIAEIARAYNQAIVGVEANNQGIATLSALKKIYPIHKIYHREVFDENFNTMTQKIGWLTTKPSRLLAIADMMGFVREHKLQVRSRKLVDECLTFVRNKDGKPEAQEGCNDDRVMAMAIACQMWKANPFLAEHPPQITRDDAEKRFKERLKRLKQRDKSKYREI